ncbi:MAG: stage III sporulation protein AB [Acutalibacteraceae bacterium]
MAWLCKLCGLSLIFSVCACIGFLKSAALKKRHKKLLGIYRSMSDLRERIRMGAGEIERLVNLCFEEDAAFIADGKLWLDRAYLDKEDAALLEEFFRDLGMSDSEAEYERIGIYMALAEKRCCEAEKRCGELCRLYGALGILCGIFICIFLL